MEEEEVAKPEFLHGYKRLQLQEQFNFGQPNHWILGSSFCPYLGCSKLLPIYFAQLRQAPFFPEHSSLVYVVCISKTALLAC